MTLDELNEHLEMRERLEKAQEMLAFLRAAAQPGAAKLTGMPHPPGVNDKVGDLAVEIADLSSRIDELTAEIARRELPVKLFIDTCDDDQTRIMLRLRFLRGLSWKEVSQVCGKYTTESSVKSACYRFLLNRDEA